MTTQGELLVRAITVLNELQAYSQTAVLNCGSLLFADDVCEAHFEEVDAFIAVSRTVTIPRIAAGDIEAATRFLEVANNLRGNAEEVTQDSQAATGLAPVIDAFSASVEDFAEVSARAGEFVEKQTGGIVLVAGLGLAAYLLSLLLGLTGKKGKQ